MVIRKTNSLIKIFNESLIDLPSPSSISYLWNYGSLLGVCLILQILSGIFLAMHYCSSSNLAFESISHIIRNVNLGWFMRFLHANGASLFFLCIYIHIARGLYYASYLRKNLWFSGIIIYVLVMATAFLGYVLPWGQMSFWGATVITNFFSAIPYIGNTIVLWLWGGFSVGGATLTRFYSLHYLLPFLITALIIIHLILLHEKGSNSSLGIGENSDKIHFHPYFVIKDVYGLFLLIMLLFFIIFFFPNVLGDPENFIQANPLITPVHILPEWYYLFAYAILRAIPNKLGGFLALICSIIILFILPLVHSSLIKPLVFRPIGKIFFWLFIFNFILLTLLGGKPVETPFVELSIFSGLFYFIYFFLFIPILGLIENKLLIN